VRRALGIAGMLAVWLVVQAGVGLAGPPPGGPGMGGGEMGLSGPPSGPPSFLSQLFTPKLVMEHQQDLGLQPAQIEAIKQAMIETQRQLVDLQWKLDGETEALAKLVAAEHVDEAAALAKFEAVTALEQQVKRANFALLVRIKNALDAKQQEKLRSLRQARMPGPPGQPGGPPPPPPD
jgi:Spy/CpxP family protein refolding chaperone